MGTQRILILTICAILAFLLLTTAQADSPQYSGCHATPTLEPGTGEGHFLTPSSWPTATPLPYYVFLPIVQYPGCDQ